MGISEINRQTADAFLSDRLLNQFGDAVFHYSQRFFEHKKSLIIQAFAIALGIAAAIIVSLFDYHTLAKLWKIYHAGSLVSRLCLRLPRSVSPGQDQMIKAWLSLFGITITALRLLKIAFVFTFCASSPVSAGGHQSSPNILLLCLHGVLPPY